MTEVVLDASTAVSWVVRSQATPAALEVLADQDITLFSAPHLFPSEVRAALLKLERRGRLAAAETREGLAALDVVDVRVQAAPTAAGLERLMSLARETQLSFYDAQYLDLALHGRRCLVSRDKALLKAARDRGLPVRSTGASS